MPSYATPADMLNFYDVNTVGQLVNDTGTPQNSTQLLTDPNLAAILSSSSGTVLSYCLRGGIYSDAQLQALTDISQEWLKQLVCDIAIWRCVLRRGLPISEYPQCQLALQSLAALAAGQQLFNVATVIEAEYGHDPVVTIGQILAKIIPGIVFTFFLSKLVPNSNGAEPQIQVLGNFSYSVPLLRHLKSSFY